MKYISVFCGFVSALLLLGVAGAIESGMVFPAWAAVGTVLFGFAAKIAWRKQK